MTERDNLNSRKTSAAPRLGPAEAGNSLNMLRLAVGLGFRAPDGKGRVCAVSAHEIVGEDGINVCI